MARSPNRDRNTSSPPKQKRKYRYLRFHLEPSSPETEPQPLTVPTSPNREQPTFQFLRLRSKRSNASVAGSATTDSQEAGLAFFQSLPLPALEHDPFSRKATPPRLPRHVPIVIPDFAHPFAIKPKYVENETSVLPQPDPQAPLLRRVSRNLPPKQLLLPIGVEKNLAKSITNAPSLSSMNSSQVSLANSEASIDGAHASQAGNTPVANVGISPINQQSSGPTHLSGLVCSVDKTTGQKPHALVGATTTILGDKLYVFGGRVHSKTKPQLTSDLFELDLIRRHWVKVDCEGDIPPPRYFHSVCPLGDSKLVCYGGMSPAPRQSNGQANKPSQEPQPEVVVMSDIHVYDVSKRAWILISTSDGPQGRYAHCAAILPSSAVFTSANAPLSAIHHNPSSSDPHSGTLGVQLDGTGGAEMVVVGGQDSSNNYIEQINVFNLRSLKWTGITPWDRKCGAYKSMVVPMTGLSAELMGEGVRLDDPQDQQSQTPGTPMLIYSNYNFLDVKLELQVRLPDGTLAEKSMVGPVSPPGLRFPNGGILDNHFVVSGTYLTSSKHEYALWALDLKTLTWGRIDTNVSIFEQGSWNRGVLWNRRNTFVILGHRERSLVDDYNHRRINFSHVCLVELEAFGLYDNPRKAAPTSGYSSVSAPQVPASLQSLLPLHSAAGRRFTSTAEQLGQAALSLGEISDMELVALRGERIACNSHILSRRWGPYFSQLLAESATTHDNSTIMSEAQTLRPNMHSQATSRNSAVTITPSVANGIGANRQGPGNEPLQIPSRSMSRSTTRTLVDLPNPSAVPASSRPRSLYLPHMVQTIQLLLYYLYTSSLPSVGTPLCTPHILCSLLQMARPYQVDGLLEATVERLHEVLDGRNAAAVFNAAAMAAGGGDGLGVNAANVPNKFGRRESEATTVGDNSAQALAARTAALKLTTNFDKTNGTSNRRHGKTNSADSSSTTTSASTSTDFSHTDTESTQDSSEQTRKSKDLQEAWSGEISSVIGLQKRGLRGLMEGRRLRERANTVGSAEDKGI